MTNNSARPTLTITGPTTETKDAFTVTFTFNRAVTGFDATDVTVTRGSKGAFTETTTGTVWTLRVTPSAGEDDNDVQVSVAQDAATANGVGNAAASKDFDVDTKVPELSTATVDGNSLVLTYDETLAATDPGKDAYTVEERTGNTGAWSAVTVSLHGGEHDGQDRDPDAQPRGDPRRQRPRQLRAARLEQTDRRHR